MDKRFKWPLNQKANYSDPPYHHNSSRGYPKHPHQHQQHPHPHSHSHPHPHAGPVYAPHNKTNSRQQHGYSYQKETSRYYKPPPPPQERQERGYQKETSSYYKPPPPPLPQERGGGAMAPPSSGGAPSSDVVTLIVENNNLKRMIMLHLNLMQEQTDSLDAKDKELDEQNTKLSQVLVQNQDLKLANAKLEATIEELRKQLRKRNKRTNDDDDDDHSLPPSAGPLLLHAETQTELVKHAPQHMQPMGEPHPQHEQLSRIRMEVEQELEEEEPQLPHKAGHKVAGTTNLPPASKPMESKARGEFNGKKVSTIFLHRVNQDSSLTSSKYHVHEEMPSQAEEENQQQKLEEEEQLQLQEKLEAEHLEHQLKTEHFRFELSLQEQDQSVVEEVVEEEIFHDALEPHEVEVEVEVASETIVGAEEEVLGEENAPCVDANGHMEDQEDSDEDSEEEADSSEEGSSSDEEDDQEEEDEEFVDSPLVNNVEALSAPEEDLWPNQLPPMTPMDLNMVEEKPMAPSAHSTPNHRQKPLLQEEEVDSEPEQVQAEEDSLKRPDLESEDRVENDMQLELDSVEQMEVETVESFTEEIVRTETATMEVEIHTEEVVTISRHAKEPQQQPKAAKELKDEGIMEAEPLKELDEALKEQEEAVQELQKPSKERKASKELQEALERGNKKVPTQQRVGVKEQETPKELLKASKELREASKERKTSKEQWEAAKEHRIESKDQRKASKERKATKEQHQTVVKGQEETSKDLQRAKEVALKAVALKAVAPKTVSNALPPASASTLPKANSAAIVASPKVTGAAVNASSPAKNLTNMTNFLSAKTQTEPVKKHRLQVKIRQHGMFIDKKISSSSSSSSSSPAKPAPSIITDHREDQDTLEPQVKIKKLTLLNDKPISRDQDQDTDPDTEETIEQRGERLRLRLLEHLNKEQRRQSQSMKQKPSKESVATNLIFPPTAPPTITPAPTPTTTPSSTPASTPQPTPTSSSSQEPIASPSTKSKSKTTTTAAAAAAPLTPQSISSVSSSNSSSAPTRKTNNNCAPHTYSKATARSGRSKSRFRTATFPYTTRSWEDQEFHCDNEFFLEEADELLADNPSLEIPKWRDVPVTPSSDKRKTEPLSDADFERRHSKYVKDEIDRKCRDARYMKEQVRIESLRMRHNQDEVLVSLDPLPTSTFYPLPEDIEGIQFVTEVPVQAFGENMVNMEARDDFSLPWIDARQALTSIAKSKAQAVPVATLASKKLPTTPAEARHQEKNSSYVFLKRRKRPRRH
ncbi:protein male-specific lethal-1 [Drosophila kikkawai]|uniref:Protein male-specific lethal-1 n=1 Tax=Drosophila kikkawai TaxID=30033 RepID=A0A6P4IZ02_DROKI|nr:protein male-specific lethal-1 [Drosophila kikkawai]